MFVGGNPIVMLKLTCKSVHQLRASKTNLFRWSVVGENDARIGITIVKDVISDQSACGILVIG